MRSFQGRCFDLDIKFFKPIWFSILYIFCMNAVLTYSPVVVIRLKVIVIKSAKIWSVGKPKIVLS